MKKIAPIAAIALLAIGFTSCKKDYACKCKTSTGEEVKSQTFKAKKSDAKASCESLQSASMGMFTCTID